MDSDDLSQKLILFAKGNLLILALIFLGLIFLSIGLMHLFNQPKEKVLLPENSIVTEDEQVRELLVDVSGAVEKPGVHALPVKSRVQDALIAAGGLSSEADRTQISKSINLAQMITDGMKIYVPVKGEVINSQVMGISSGAISINSAPESELDKLPGIGPVTAQKIVSLRPYSSIDELLSKKAVSSSVFEKIKDKISL